MHFSNRFVTLCDALRDMAPIAQLKNTHRVLLLIKLQASDSSILKVTLLRWCFSRFLYCKNGTKSRNASHL